MRRRPNVATIQAFHNASMTGEATTAASCSMVIALGDLQLQPDAHNPFIDVPVGRRPAVFTAPTFRALQRERRSFGHDY